MSRLVREYSGRPATTALLLLAFGVPALGHVSQGRLHDHNFHGWFVYSGDHPVGGRWGAHLELQWRRHDFIAQPQQLLLRPAINLRLTERVGFSSGYAYVSTHRYGSYPIPAPFPEHRIYQQVTLRHGSGKVELQHRGRLEQRWIGTRTAPLSGTIGLDGWRYQNRVRYLLRLGVPLKNPRWYIAVSNEIFLNLPPRHSAATFDQNRAFAGLGYKLGKDTRLEAGYLQQSLLQRSGRVLELNHTIQIGLYSTLPFRR